MLTTRQKTEGFIAQGLHRKHDDRALDTLMDMGVFRKRWTHYKKRENTYVITGFGWDVETQEWAVLYKEVNSPIIYVRKFSEFFGKPDFEEGYRFLETS